MTPNDFALPDHCYQHAVHRVLHGSSLSPSRQAAVAKLTGRTDGLPLDKRAAALAHLVGSDFDWPWFDQWAARFAADRSWPTYTLGWDWIEAATMPAHATAADYLRKLKKAELLALAKCRGVDVAKGIQVAPLRCVLLKALGRAGLSEEIAKLSSTLNDESATRAAWEKVRLLAHSLSFAGHARHRMDQIAVLLKDSQSRWRVYLDPGEAAEAWASSFCTGWVFNPNDPNNLPPFFPGDVTSLHTERLSSR